ncbi:hypothetical protein PanWU01x14_279800 [Parasponia andersonii]|uniref:Uncharacterized protein n=1 Tax=Parasponia andersonii TaxID=3476 RepID=A0A2P5B1G9_PARAD|nr:hypothetical protein PanWU01x14_279800 [Parasponia andersonii]
MTPQKPPIVFGSLRRVGQSRVRGVDLHKLIGRRILPIDRRHVRVANPSQSPVRSLDLLTRGHRRDPEDLVQRRRHDSPRVQVRRRRRRRLIIRRCVGGRGGGACGNEPDR